MFDWLDTHSVQDMQDMQDIMVCGVWSAASDLLRMEEGSLRLVGKASHTVGRSLAAVGIRLSSPTFQFSVLCLQQRIYF